MSQRITIEQAGTGGTSLGKFTRTSPVAVAEKVTDSYGLLRGWKIRDLGSREVIGELHPATNDGYYFPWNVDEPTGATHPAADGSRTFMESVAAILGTPGYGYTHYRQAS